MNTTKLINRIQQNIPLDFGDIFGKSIDLFKKTWLQGFLFTILSIVFMLPAILVIYIPLIGTMAYQDFSEEYNYESLEVSWVGMIPFFLLFIVAIIFLNTIIFAMNAGFFKMVRRLDHGEEVSSGDLFSYVKGKYLKKSFAISLMTIGISILAALLCYLPLIYVMVPLSFVAVIFAFNPELTASEIIRVSFSLGNKKWLIAFGLLIVTGILSELVGFLLCGIGIFFTASFVYLPIYLIYKQVVGFEDEEKAIEA